MASRVLIVDDEKGVRLTLGACLEEAGYEVFTAVSGEHAITQAAEALPAVVLLDMKLPDIDGVEVLARLRRDHPSAQVVIITGYGTVETAVEAMKLGACDYLRKPFSPDEIRGLVARLLKRHELDEAAAGKDYEACLEFAKRCLQGGEYERAIGHLQRAAAMRPGQGEPYNLMGLALEVRGRLDDARRMYRAALAFDPSYAAAAQNLDRVSRLPYPGRVLDLKQATAAAGATGETDRGPGADHSGTDRGAGAGHGSGADRGDEAEG